MTPDREIGSSHQGLIRNRQMVIFFICISRIPFRISIVSSSGLSTVPVGSGARGLHRIDAAVLVQVADHLESPRRRAAKDLAASTDEPQRRRRRIEFFVDEQSTCLFEFMNHAEPFCNWLQYMVPATRNPTSSCGTATLDQRAGSSPSTIRCAAFHDQRHLADAGSPMTRLFFVRGGVDSARSSIWRPMTCRFLFRLEVVNCQLVDQRSSSFCCPCGFSATCSIRTGRRGG